MSKNAENDKTEDVNSNKVTIPASFFADFGEITQLNKLDFEYVVY